MARKSYMSHLTGYAFTLGDLERSHHGPHIFNEILTNVISGTRPIFVKENPVTGKLY